MRQPMQIGLPPVGSLQINSQPLVNPVQAQGRVLAAGAPAPQQSGGIGGAMQGLGEAMQQFADIRAQSRQQERLKASVDRYFQPTVQEQGQGTGDPLMGGTTQEKVMGPSPIDQMGLSDPQREFLEGLYEAGDYRGVYEVLGELTMREPPEQGDQFRVLTQDEAARYGLPADGSYQINAKTGKISSVGSKGTNVTVNTTLPGEQSQVDEAVAGLNVKFLTEYGTRLGTLDEQAGAYRQMERAIEGGAFQGAAAPLKLFLGQLGASLGMDVQGVSETELLQSITNRLAPGMRPEGSGPMSDADLRLFLNSLPNLTLTKGGNRKVLRYLKRINDYQRRVLDAKAKYFEENGRAGLLTSPYAMNKYLQEQGIYSPFQEEDRELFLSLSGGQGTDDLTTQDSDQSVPTTGSGGWSIEKQ